MKKSNFIEKIYLDYNATAPPLMIPRSKLKSWTNSWGNPSSIHWAGRDTKNLINQSKRDLAKWIGARPDEIIFTSGGSESNNLAIKGFFLNLLDSLPQKLGFKTQDSQTRIFYSKQKDQKEIFREKEREISQNKNSSDLLISAVEHPSVLEVAKFLTNWGLKCDFLPINKAGNIDLKVYEEKLKKNPKLVSIMFANNETGNIFPIKKLATLAHRANALFHCDAVQALGKTLFNVKNLGLDLASFSGHKFYAFKGSGFLYLKSGVKINCLIHGGKQEHGFRAGTENALSIASMGFMANYFSSQEEKIIQQIELMRKKRDQMEEKILNSIPDVSIVGKENKRLPNTSNLVFKDLDGESLLMNLDLKGFALSSGSACSSGTSHPSSVLQAMGFSSFESRSSLRVSLGLRTKKKEIDSFLKNLVQSVKLLRQTK